jgi:hypothetical protein
MLVSQHYFCPENGAPPLTHSKRGAMSSDNSLFCPHPSAQEYSCWQGGENRCAAPETTVTVTHQLEDAVQIADTY